MIDHDVYFRAMKSRDPRFDGRFFVGVKTTKIYCRPICPARPHSRNVEFFESALASEKAGYRPCLRCRPECAPLSAAWTGTSALVSRALKKIAKGERLLVNEDEFAHSFGVSARHLRRLFIAEIGKAPKRIADDQRLNFARQLVVETSLPFTKVSEAAGFDSLRRFNSAFKARFSRPPTQLRRRKSKGDDGWIEISLAYRPPFDFDATLDFHRRHAISGIESVEGAVYKRLALIDRRVVEIEIADDPERNALRLRMRTGDVSLVFPISRRVRAMFDLDSDPIHVDGAFQKISRLKSLYEKTPGLRIARGFDPFETTIATVLGQLVSIDRANHLVSELIRNYGEKATHPHTGEEVRFFPPARTLAKAKLDKVGTTTIRKQAIREIAKRVNEGQLVLDSAIVDAGEVKERILEIRGVGPWTAEYVGLRALGDVDSFPAKDLVLARSLKGLDLESVRPWRSYAAVHLWKENG